VRKGRKRPTFNIQLSTLKFYGRICRGTERRTPNDEVENKGEEGPVVSGQRREGDVAELNGAALALEADLPRIGVDVFAGVLQDAVDARLDGVAFDRDVDAVPLAVRFFGGGRLLLDAQVLGVGEAVERGLRKQDVVARVAFLELRLDGLGQEEGVGAGLVDEDAAVHLLGCAVPAVLDVECVVRIALLRRQIPERLAGAADDPAGDRPGGVGATARLGGDDLGPARKIFAVEKAEFLRGADGLGFDNHLGGGYVRDAGQRQAGQKHVHDILL